MLQKETINILFNFSDYFIWSKGSGRIWPICNYVSSNNIQILSALIDCTIIFV